MDWNADHAGFITASYAISIVWIVGLVIYTFMRDCHFRKSLKQFEKTET